MKPKMMKQTAMHKYVARGVYLAVAAAIGLMVLVFGGCKDFGAPNYQLVVKVASGVQGTPTDGTYTYKDLSAVDYNFAPEDTNYAIEVLVNGSRWSSTSTLVMYTDTTLEARLMDIRGKWAVTMKPSLTTGTTYKFNITFAGDSFISGTFSDDQGPGLGYHGKWKITGGTTLTIIYTDWKDYQLTGNVSLMSGNWTGETETNGSWTATQADD
ncbi:MAG: hypothetical protein ACM3SY_14290 [Candidatus Omnitrophota bacterium]